MVQTQTLVFTAEMIRLIAEIDEFKGAWRALGNLAPDKLLQLRKVATIESIGSSTRIEGSHLSRNSLRRHLEKLVQNQLIRQNGKGKSTWYTLL